jgi:SAM-dependent methyltransferase
MSCPLCHHNDFRLNGWVAQGSSYYECQRCGFIFLPRPITYSAGDVYNADYARLRGHDLIDSVIHKSKLKTAQWYLNKISKYTSVKTMLDVGCSTGANVAKAVELGWQASGMDINEAALKTAQSYISNAKFYKSLADIEQTFSLITLFDVIEHIEDLDSFIKQIKQRLGPQGILFILTPDGQSLSARVLKNQWPHLFNEHISLFSKSNLTNFLEHYQFKVLETGFAWKFVSLQGMYRHAACHFQEGWFSNTVKTFMSPLKNTSLIIPFNIGEFYLIAQNL